jgi:adenylate kinase family enzyme
MALALSNNLRKYFGPEYAEEARDSFSRVFAANWESSELDPNNTFSTVVVLRTAGFLTTAGVLDCDWIDSQRKNHLAGDDKTLREIACWMGEDTQRFSIQDYPPTATVLYWFVDGIHRTKTALDEQVWDRVCSWASEELHRQESLVHSDHDAQMDPVAMAMAACLCSRLEKIAREGVLGTTNNHLMFLPSAVELQHAIELLFTKQSSSGIWPKYFPLFHYPKAGSNFCFTFEMLEAILAEFGEDSTAVLDRPRVMSGLECSLEWSERNRLAFPVQEDGNRVIYQGWNSGGELDSLRAGMPESWATAVVHMFLSELQHVLSHRIKTLILDEYEALSGNNVAVRWDDLVDVDVELRNRGRSTVGKVLEDYVLSHAKDYDSTQLGKMEGRTSALLFGPPGTSKTTLVRAFAARLGWPIVEIEPSDFLTDGMENIYGRARAIFEDLEDLSGVVVFFDEMDALVRTREDEHVPLDVMSRFLTTSMLPKLAKLHDDRRVVFFFATNYQEQFDPAIKRPGRFDILLCIGPPTWQSKLEALDRLVPSSCPPDKVDNVKTKLEELAGEATDEKQKELLDLLTFSETKTFLEILQDGGEFVAKLEGLTALQFFGRLGEFAKTITLRKDVEEETKPKTPYERYEKEKALSALQ